VLLGAFVAIIFFTVRKLFRWFKAVAETKATVDAVETVA
jgi:hypothetical protein